MALVQIPPAATGLSWRLLNSGGTSLSGASTITVSGISDIEYLLVEVSGASSGVSQDEFRFRINADSGGNYNNFGTYISTASAYNANNFVRVQATNTSIINFAQMTSNAGSTCSGFMFITGGRSSGIKTYQVVGGSDVVSTSVNGVHYNIAGHYVGSAPVSSISIISANSSNFDAGTIWVYGA